ncbi:hypothetical protein PMSD_06695 [Paenibacillus macquariensis subsp. defensor]|uniref:Uncharacterized protein n=1 Tax=Paenibacillus antarcticus TaxID=253703 RepID=A0A168PVC5_9BACL|nr:hypothetical protein PMSD_06695 [Paenibacillus macquariensis subsp. defensor]OAB47108.1 hypothetical protein PBAT_07445 [Paenibacillus antarcticus]
MDNGYFKGFQKMSHENEMRSVLLIRGVKRILEAKKEESFLKKIFQKKKHIEPKAWKKIV